MEDFLKEKLGHGEAGFTNDWPAFEQKLERALFFKQMRVGAMVSLVLILLSLGFFGGSSFSRFNIFQNGNKASTEPYGGEGRFSGFNKTNNTAYHSEAENKIATQAKAEQQFRAELNEERGVPKNAISQPIVSTSNKDKLTFAKRTDIAEAASQNVAIDNLEVSGAEGGSVALGVASSLSESSNTEKPAQSIVAAQAKMAGEAEDNVQIEEVESPYAGPTDVPETGKVALSKGTAASGLAMVPDGLEGSNFKANVKPIELMMDLREVQNMDLRAPIIPMKLVQARKEAYVSPLQEKKPWSYSIKVYPNFTYRKFTVAANKMAYIHSDFIDQVKVSETGGFSLNVGFEASKRIGRITYLNFGVEYISYKTEANFDFMNYRDAVISPESGKITSYDFKKESEHIVIVDANRYHYLNFPLSISYRPWATDHVRLNIEAGASYMYFVKATGKSIDYQTLEIIDLSDRDYRNSMASVCLKVGASYHVSEQFSLGFEPTVVYFSNTIYTEEYPFEVVPYSAGINFKLQMKLN